MAQLEIWYDDCYMVVIIIIPKPRANVYVWYIILCNYNYYKDNIFKQLVYWFTIFAFETLLILTPESLVSVHLSKYLYWNRNIYNDEFKVEFSDYRLLITYTI